ncbi:acetyltransferase [Geobacillus kaustophilus]|uniref:acetyltransferase n=1 Tax=Geobacillus kaustophilus TaxID=1462 RepID=UPI002E1A4BCB|nr:acetyltransferase [Geobacillus kaustophilus]
MQDIVIYGAGGFAREVAYLIEIINEKKVTWNLKGYIDDNPENTGKILNGYPVLGTSEWLLSLNQEINVVIGIGSPRVKKLIYNKLKDYSHIKFPNIIHPDVRISNTNKIGMGNIICEGNILTCNIEIGNFVIVNLNCTIGHDTVIEDYTTILPNSSISGNVRLKEGVDFGTNATIIQGVSVGEYAIIGAGAVIVKDIPPHCTAVGVPAKPIKFHDEANQA